MSGRKNQTVKQVKVVIVPHTNLFELLNNVHSTIKSVTLLPSEIL